MKKHLSHCCDLVEVFARKVFLFCLSDFFFVTPSRTRVSSGWCEEVVQSLETIFQSKRTGFRLTCYCCALCRNQKIRKDDEKDCIILENSFKHGTCMRLKTIFAPDSVLSMQPHPHDAHLMCRLTISRAARRQLTHNGIKLIFLGYTHTHTLSSTLASIIPLIAKRLKCPTLDFVVFTLSTFSAQLPLNRLIG